MKVFYTTDFRGHYPVGTAAVVKAETIEDARKIMDKELAFHELKPSSSESYSLIELPLDVEGAIILNDGDY